MSLDMSGFLDYREITLLRDRSVKDHLKLICNTVRDQVLKLTSSMFTINSNKRAYEASTLYPDDRSSE